MVDPVVVPKKKRTRRKFAKIVSAVEQYCEVSIKVIGANEPNDFQKGKMAAFREIAAQLGGNANG